MKKIVFTLLIVVGSFCSAGEDFLPDNLDNQSLEILEMRPNYSVDKDGTVVKLVFFKGGYFAHILCSTSDICKTEDNKYLVKFNEIDKSKLWFFKYSADTTKKD